MNMENNFENYIDKNRGGFEQGAPSADVWQGLKNKLEEHHAEKRRVKKIALGRWTAAAAFIIVAGAAAIFYIKANPQKPIAQGNKIVPPVIAQHQLAGRDSEMRKDEAGKEQVPQPNLRNSYVQEDTPNSIKFYQASIKQKEQQVDKLLGDMPALDKDFRHALNDLNEIIEHLQSSLPQSIDKEKIIKVIIKNLQMQEAILDSQLQALKDLQNSNAHENLHS